MNKEPRLRFTDEERSDPALEKPIRKAEKAAARADKAQANIPKKKVRQTVIAPDTGKKTSKLIFEDKKKPPSKVSQGVREPLVQTLAEILPVSTMPSPRCPSVWRRQRPSWITSISSRLPQRRKSESHSFMKKNCEAKTPVWWSWIPCSTSTERDRHTPSLLLPKAHGLRCWIT